MEHKRQVFRRFLFGEAMADVNGKNLKDYRTGRFTGMKRRQRRQLARAYAKRYWINRPDDNDMVESADQDAA